MASIKITDPAADDRADEAWIRTAGGEISIRLRSLTHYLDKGGALVDARLIESDEGLYSVWVRLADRAGEFRINQFHNDQPKTYREVSLAIAMLRDDFGYFGSISVQTDRRRSRAT